MSTVTTSSEGRLVLYGVTWQTYERLLRAFDDRHLRLTYDRGALEIMTLSSEHERFKSLLTYLILILVEELGWHTARFGSMTMKRRKRKRGLEPDECFWIQSEPLVRGKDHIDILKDPPADLVLEIDVTHSSLDRLLIYAVLGIPEVWRFEGQVLHVHLLDSNGRYVESNQSRAFPFFPMPELMRFLGMRSSMSETDLGRQFRTWVQARVAAGWQ